MENSVDLGYGYKSPDDKSPDDKRAAIIPMKEYNELIEYKKLMDSLKVGEAREKLKQEIIRSLIPHAGTHVHNDTHTTEKNMKGVGIFGLYLSLAIVFVAMLYFKIHWGWWSIPLIIGISSFVSLKEDSYW